MPNPEPQPPVPFEEARERVIQSLSTHFANDALSLDDLERRIELAYHAKTLAELQTLTSDLDRTAGGGAAAGGAAGSASVAPSAPPRRVALADAAPYDRVVAVMSDSSRSLWPVPRHLDVYVVMGNATIDLRQSPLPELVEIHVRNVMGSVRVVVPRGVHVVNHLGALMANVAMDLGAPMPIPAEAPVVRLTGFAVMSEVRIVVA